MGWYEARCLLNVIFSYFYGSALLILCHRYLILGNKEFTALVLSMRIFTREAIKITGLTLLLGGLAFIDDYLLQTPLMHTHKWYFILFFFFLSIVTTYLVSIGIRRSPGLFQGYFFGAMLLRMGLCIGIIFWFVQQGVTQLLSFILTFFVMYFLYLFIEIYALVKTLKRKV